MTTIAANLECMAADSLCVTNFADFPIEKIRVINGSILGGTGSVSAILKFFDWFATGCKRKTPHIEKHEDFEIIELNSDGVFLWPDSCFLSVRVPRGYHAVGAGGQAALALMMHHDATPENAVSQSCDVVPSVCSRPVHTYWLRDAVKRKGRSRKS